MNDDWAAIRAEQDRARRRREQAWKVIGVILSVLIFAALIALGIWLRNVMPCDWMPAKDAPARCFTGVSR